MPARPTVEEPSDEQTVIDMLRSILSDIESGKIRPNQAIVIYVTPYDQKGDQVVKHSVNVDHTRAIGLMEIIKLTLIEEWQGRC